MPDGILDQILVLLAQLAQFIANLINQIVSFISGLISQFVTWFANAIATFLNAVIQALSGIALAIENAIRSVLTVIERVVTDIREFLAGLWEQIQQATVAVLDAIANYVLDVVASIRAFVDTVVDSIRSFVSDVVAFVRDLVDAGLSAIQSLALQVAETVRGIVGGIVDAVALAVGALQVLVVQSIEAILGTAQSLISTIGERLADLATAFADSVTDLLTGLAGLAEEQIGPIRTTIREFAKEFAVWTDPQEVERLSSILEDIASPGTLLIENRQRAADFIRAILPGRGFTQFFFGTVIVLFVVVRVFHGIADANAQFLLQEFGQLHPYQVLTPADVTAAWRRGHVSREQAVETIRKQGYSAEDALVILNLSSTVPNEGDLLALVLRQQITPQELGEQLHLRGYDPVWRDRFLELARLIPPVQDLITMAVREVFTPEVAERFGQFEGFPEAFAEEAAKHGLTLEWARRYWAAHWALPSPQQGFEMLHRGVIGEEDLGLLLRALDVMPFWREKLTAIAFNPFTRVDIRRMHALGVLTEEDVFRAHLDLGYDESKARLLTEFVKKLNRRTPAEDDVELGRLSRTAILGFYEDGLLPRTRAQELLVAAGHTAEAAALYLDSVDVGIERQERKAESDLLIELAEAGTITFEEAEDRMRALGLETLEVERAITKLLRARQRKVKLPTRDDGENFLSAGVINEGEYRDLLARIGYSPRWVDAYVNLFRRKQSAA